MTELNTTTVAQVSEVRASVEKLREGLNEHDSSLSVEQRVRTAGASEALYMASLALNMSFWNLMRLERPDDLG